MNRLTDARQLLLTNDIQIGFEPSLMNEHTRYYFTEQTVSNLVNGFTLQCDVPKEAPKYIQFTAFTKIEALGQERMKALAAQFAPENIEFDFGGLAKKYEIKNPGLNTIDALQADLDAFTRKLIKAGLRPA